MSEDKASFPELVRTFPHPIVYGTYCCLVISIEGDFACIGLGNLWPVGVALIFWPLFFWLFPLFSPDLHFTPDRCLYTFFSLYCLHFAYSVFFPGISLGVRQRMKCCFVCSVLSAVGFPPLSSGRETGNIIVFSNALIVKSASASQREKGKY